jgi:hypothetical protein
MFAAARIEFRPEILIHSPKKFRYAILRIDKTLTSIAPNYPRAQKVRLGSPLTCTSS